MILYLLLQGPLCLVLIRMHWMEYLMWLLPPYWLFASSWHFIVINHCAKVTELLLWYFLEHSEAGKVPLLHMAPTLGLWHRQWCWETEFWWIFIIWNCRENSGFRGTGLGRTTTVRFSFRKLSELFSDWCFLTRHREGRGINRVLTLNVHNKRNILPATVYSSL